MKKIIPILSLAILFTACKSNNSADNAVPILLTPDNTNIQTASADTMVSNEPIAKAIRKNSNKPTVVEKTIVVYREPKKAAVEVAMPTPAAPPVVTAPVPESSTLPPAAGTDNTTASTGTPGDAGAGTDTEVPEKKTGISKSAKGAIIGGVGGAVVGAVIGKNAKGAILGGVIGAAGGYVLGRKQDKKDGRIEFSH
ncbi:MAG: glycine zipper 2TM domain-containing protein [Niastella sp.]|nr:glycine zipper 2TM domain-containing protein [Niastella sp.]